MAAITLAEAKTHLKISVTTYYTQLADFILVAEDCASDVLNGPVSTQSYTDTYDGGNQFGIVLRNRPVISVQSVTMFGVAVDPTNWHLDDAGVLWYVIGYYAKGGFYTGVGNVQVSYTAGYSPVPAKLKYGVKEMVRVLWETQRGNSPSQGPDDDYVDVQGFLFPRRVLQPLEHSRKPDFV